VRTWIHPIRITAGFRGLAPIGVSADAIRAFNNRLNNNGSPTHVGLSMGNDQAINRADVPFLIMGFEAELYPELGG
jgi:hypothetical protein